MEDRLKSLTHELNKLTETIRSDGASLEGHSEQLSQLTDAANTFAKLNRGPFGHISEVATNIVMACSLSLFNKWRAFDHIPSGESISYQALAEKLDADTALITRLAWNLVASGILKQIGEDQVTQTPVSVVLSAPPLNALVERSVDDHLRTVSCMSAYFTRYGLREPSSQLNTIYSFAAGDPSLTFWEHMNRDPERMQKFMASMAAMATLMPTVGSYDFGWVVEASKAEPDRTLVVDVGGGRGHALEAILEATPGLDLERCVVGDLAQVAEEAKGLANGELRKAKFAAMDFHNEQPIKGALVYYIRRCLHDYGDDDAVRILQQIRAAMLPESRCLIVEQVMSNPPSAMAAANDLFMAAQGGKERTLEDFRDVTSRAGLELREVYPAGDKSDVAVIECALA